MGENMVVNLVSRFTGGLNERERTLFPLDTMRQGIDGIFDTLKNTVFLLVAIRYYQMPDLMNSLISIAPFFGMLAGLFINPILEKHLSPRGVLFFFTLFMGLALVSPLLLPGEIAYTVGVSLCMILFSVRIPFITGFYNECYRVDRMARLMSLGTLTMILVGTGSSWLFGQMLDRDIAFYRLILLFSGSLFFINAFFLRSLPPRENRHIIKKEPFWASLKLIWQDPRFGITSLSWMILGFANLWSTPIRTVFLSDPERGLGLDPPMVLFILGIIPGIVRLISNFIWAHFYDKSRFVTIRMIMNIFIGIGIFLFFISRSIWIICLGSALIHMSLAGTPFVWNLWVTRLAPPGETRKYMTVHTFLCGIRGLVGPPLAFAYIQSHDIQRVGMISTVLALISCIAMLPLFMKRFTF